MRKIWNELLPKKSDTSLLKSVVEQNMKYKVLDPPIYKMIKIILLADNEDEIIEKVE